MCPDPLEHRRAERAGACAAAHRPLAAGLSIELHEPIGIMKILLDGRADVNIPDPGGRTPLELSWVRTPQPLQPHRIHSPAR